jgi:hypothetical protein
MGPWDMGIPLYRLFAVPSELGTTRCWITLALLVLTAIIWYLSKTSVPNAEWEQFEYDRRITDWELKRGFERS